MYFTIENDLIDNHLAVLGPYGFAVYCAIRRLGFGPVAMAQVADKVGCSYKTAQREVVRLAKLGFVGKLSGKDNGLPNTYFALPLPKVAVTRG